MSGTLTGYHACERGFGCPRDFYQLPAPVRPDVQALEVAALAAANDEWLSDVMSLLFQAHVAQRLGFSELQAAAFVGAPYGSQGDLALLFGVSQPTVSRAQLDQLLSHLGTQGNPFAVGALPGAPTDS
jgi:hypothetical protein